MKFCNEKYFTNAFNSIVEDNQPKELDYDLIMKADQSRKEFCFFLANIYIACNTCQYEFRRSIPGRIDEIVHEWISLKNLQEHEISTVKIAKLKCVYDFLSKCIEEFKYFNYTTLEYILDKAILFNTDLTIQRFVYFYGQNDIHFILFIFSFKYFFKYFLKQRGHFSGGQYSTIVCSSI